MNELMKFLVDKIGYTVLVILGFLLPGILFIFVWKREMYLEMDIAKLILLALSISFMIFAANFMCTTICFAMQNVIGHKKEGVETLIGYPLFITDVEMSFAMFYKISNPEITILQFVERIEEVVLLLLVVGFVPSLGIWIIRKIKNFFKARK